MLDRTHVGVFSSSDLLPVTALKHEYRWNLVPFSGQRKANPTDVATKLIVGELGASPHFGGSVP